MSVDLMLTIDRSSPEALVEQLYRELRAAILTGRVASLARLPSERQLARTLGVSRFTVTDAYERLRAEGYIDGRQGSGTYVVAHPADESRFRSTVRRNSHHAADNHPPRHWSTWGKRLHAQSPTSPRLPGIDLDFRHGQPDVAAFPHSTWRRLLVRVSRELKAPDLGYGPSAGELTLRKAVADYLGRSRAITVDPNQVIITSGTQQSVDLIARLSLDPEAVAVMEEPGYPTARRLLAMTGARITPIPVDASGLIVGDLTRTVANARLVYITPAHQFPAGAPLSLPRRLELIAWARSSGALIIEDDYDSEFRYGSRPIPPLASLDQHSSGRGAVVHVGTFSKVLFPALRVGYLVAPLDLVNTIERAKAVVARGEPVVTQRALAAFINDGYFERHLAKMRRLYADRLATVEAALMDETINPQRRIGRIGSLDAAGLHVLLGVRTALREAELIARAAAIGVHVDSASACYTDPPVMPTILFGYAAHTPTEITEGIRRLGGIVV